MTDQVGNVSVTSRALQPGVQLEVHTDAGSKVVLNLSYQKAAELSAALATRLGEQAEYMRQHLTHWVGSG